MRAFLFLLILMTCPLAVLAEDSKPEGAVCLLPELLPCKPLLVSQSRIQEETQGFRIDVEFPILCEPDATGAISEEMHSMVNDFKNMAPEHDRTQFPHRYELTADYAVWPAASGRIASVKMQTAFYTGGAHHNYGALAWVFDLADGTVLELNDIFMDPETALGDIADMTRDALSRSLGPMLAPDMLAVGTEPVVENYSIFILNDEGVAFFFPPYQVAPFAAGEQAVTLPYASVRDHLTPQLLDVLP